MHGPKDGGERYRGMTLPQIRAHTAVVPRSWQACLREVREENCGLMKGQWEKPCARMQDVGMGVEQRPWCLYTDNLRRPVQWERLLQIVIKRHGPGKKENGGEYKEGMNSRSKQQEVVIHLVWGIWWVQIAAHWVSSTLGYIGRADAEAPILWPTDAKSQLIGKDPDAGIDWGQVEKTTTGSTED